MPSRFSPTPQNHAIVIQHFKIDGRVVAFPVIYLFSSDGSVRRFEILVQYFLSNPHKSINWLRSCARSLGLLWDYLSAKKIDFDWDNENAHRKIIRAFTLAIRYGTIPEDKGLDILDLYWPSSSLRSAQLMLLHLLRFINWCNDEGFKTNIAITSNDFLSQESLVSFLYIARFTKGISFMAHAINPLKMAQNLAFKHREKPVDLGPLDGLYTFNNPIDSFPKELIKPFLEYGFLVNPQSNALHEQYDLTGKMIALLLFYGGLRRSEPLHIWFNDVVPNDQGCMVLIAHPELARSNLGSIPTLSRSDYLKIHGLKARTEYIGHKQLYVGWKNLKLDKNHMTQVYWIDKDAETLFREMYIYYLKYRQLLLDLRIAKGGSDHPFLFVSKGIDHNTNQDFRGAPYSYASFEKSWQRAIARTSKILNLEIPYHKSAGSTPHGARHFFGSTLAEAKVGEKVIQEALHHRSPLSQRVYTRPSKKFVLDTLNNFAKKNKD